MVIYQLKNTMADFRSYKVYQSEERCRNLARWLNKRYKTGSVYATWICSELSFKDEYGGTPEEILNLLNEKEDRISMLENLLTEMNQYDIGEMLPTSVVDRLEQTIKSISN